MPLFLAGPILRRIEPRKVTVWLALSQPAQVRVDVYGGTQDVGTGSTPATVAAPLEATGTAPTRRVGPALHIAVVQAQVTGTPLLPSTLHAYNVTAGSADLRSEGLLARTTGDRPVEPLGFELGLLPGFATSPARLEDLVLLHASCHKPHGDGPSVMSHADALIKAARTDPIKRPHQMFLTGDQIYADEVATSLLPGLAALGGELLGSGEQLPGPQGSPGPFPAGMANFPAGRRQKLSALAGFTSQAADNHLLSLGEFAAMYLVAWNGAMWPVLAKPHLPGPPGSDPLLQKLATDAADSDANAPVVLAPGAAPGIDTSFTDLFGGSEEAKEALTEARQLYHDSRVAAKKMAAEIAKVRRALANVSTYMIFDDHEVTDDWYLSRSWKERVHGRELGRAIVRNALVAYSLFQAWGNDPEAWSGGPRQDLLDAIGRLFPSGTTTGPAAAAATDVDDILGLRPGASPRLDFSFTVDGPVHRVVAIDSRTQRRFRSADGPPGLLTREALDTQLPPGPLPSGFELLIVVASSPVLGPPLMEDLGMPTAVLGVDLVNAARSEEKIRQDIERTGYVTGVVRGHERWDMEAWSASPETLEMLLARASTYGRVLFLSGDVHYGAAYSLGYAAGGPPERRSAMVQFTSSASKNAWPHNVPELVHHNNWLRVLQHLGLPKRTLGWTSPSPPVLADTLPFLVNSPGGERLSLRGKLNHAPVLLPTEGWRTSHTLSRRPEWMWELDQVLDQRPAAQRPEKARPPEIDEPDLPAFPEPPAPPIDLLRPPAGALGYSRLAQIHQQTVDLPVARGLVFLNNIGKVTFGRTGGAGGGGELTATQALFSRPLHPEDDDKPEPYTAHTATFAVPTFAFPTEIGP